MIIKTPRTAAFTLVEMIISITVFTIFIGFAMGSYLTFHRAQQEAAITRAMMLEGEEIISQITSAVKENEIVFEAYDSGGRSFDFPFDFALPDRFGARRNNFIESNKLILRDLNENREIEFLWDEEKKLLTLQKFEINELGERGDPSPGFQEGLPLNSDPMQISSLGFRIVPGKDPYLPENILEKDSSLWYQPNVQIVFQLSVPGKIREEIFIDLQTFVTSRFYR